MGEFSQKRDSVAIGRLRSVRTTAFLPGTVSSYRGGQDSYGIRVDYRADTTRAIHPELTEFLKTFKIEKR